MPETRRVDGITKLLKRAVEAVRRLPPDRQDDAARAMLAMAEADDAMPEAIDPAQLPDVLEGVAQARRRQFATAAEIGEAFRRFDP